MADGDYLTQRGGMWHFVRRVPNDYAHLDRRGIVRISLKIRVDDDPKGKRARRAADTMNGELEAYWRGLVDGRAAEARTRYEAARTRARALGLSYMPAADLASFATTDDLLARFDLLAQGRRADEPTEVAAILGGEVRPPLALSELLGRVEAIVRGSQQDMSPDQRRKWVNPKRRAIANLREVIGDKPLDKITRDDALDFRAWWQERIMSEDLLPGSANRDITELATMWKRVNVADRMALEPIWAGLRLEGEKHRPRLPFPADWIQRRLLATGALDSLNAEARAIVYLMVETGFRLAEACNLTAGCIHLDAPIPYVQVRPVGRRLKTEVSERDTPLVGVALMAMRDHPEGFPRYRDKSAGLSNALNKTLRAIGAVPSEKHTIYGLRHSFEDRLVAARTEDKLIAALMGHAFHRERYGEGPSLALKREVLHRIAFTPPERV